MLPDHAAHPRARRPGARARADGEPGDAAPGTHGSEAAIVGAVAALEADDIVVPGRREAVAALWRGHSVAALAAGAAIPRALGVLPGSPHGATQLPHATGIAWAMKMQANGRQGRKSGRRQGGARLPRPGRRPAPRTFTPG